MPLLGENRAGSSITIIPSNTHTLPSNPAETEWINADMLPPPENSSSAVTHDSSVRAYEKFFKDYFLVPRTSQKVLNSLGSFEEELIIKKIGKFECINFNLNEDGKSSLRELLDLESVDAKAHLLYKRTTDKNLKKSVEMAGILFKEPDGNKVFFLNITDLSTGYNKQNRFYDEGINPDCGRMAYTASLQLFPEINNPEIKVIRLKREALTRYLSGPYDTYFTSPFELEMLVLEDETGKDLNFIFFPSDPFSQDFQITLHVLHTKTKLFQDKTIVEIGAGTGVNNLLGLKFGAKKIKTIDISRLYVLLSRWNIEFAKETGQVEETSAEQVKINLGNSFNSISSTGADIYLFNSPSIRSKKEIKEYSKGEKTLKTIGNFMLTEDFMALFEQQKEMLLFNPDAVAIWRILPSEDSGLEKVNEAELIEFEGPRIKARDRTLLKSKAMGKKFLKESGLAFTELSPTIYMLYSPSAKSSGSPFIPDTEKQPVKPNPSSTFGGIDFRNLPIVTQARSNLSANIAGSAIARLKDINLNQEWLDIQKLTQSGIIPSPERIKEYLQGLCLKDDYSDEKARNVILCLADILRLEEENYLSTDALLKDILIVLSSTNDTPELKEAFLGKAVK